MALPDATQNKNLEGGSIRARVQKFGAYLAGMIMPNIGAFIAWGLITAIFLAPEDMSICDTDTRSGCGWIPNQDISALIGPIIIYLLPILIGYTGGRMVHGQRGAVVGAVATMGVIVGTDVPMFLGAMIMGPLSAYVLKLVDNAIQDKVPSGFEMLVDNFSLGIIGGAMAIIAKKGVGPIVEHLVDWAGDGVETLVNNNLLPLASLFVEPAKILFLNNAINHGVLTPLGSAESLDQGKSILFMVESNPGPGLGILLAYLFFGPKVMRPTTPGAIIIHFFGGIHEIYFPYVLMKPKLVLAVIAGGMCGVGTAQLFDAGLVAPAAPGSFISYMLVTPKGGYFGVIAAIVVACGVSFAVASVLMGFGRGERDVELHRPEDEVIVGT